MKIAAICGGLQRLEQYRRAARGRAPAAALINTSPRAVHALAALRSTLQTMSAQIVDEACLTLPLLGTANGEDEIIANPELAEPLHAAMTRLGAAVHPLQVAE